MDGIAMKLLGDLAYNKRNNLLLIKRVTRLSAFIKSECSSVNDALDNIKIVVNNNCSNPPSEYKNSKRILLGGTFYKYHVWAVK